MHGYSTLQRSLKGMDRQWENLDTHFSGGAGHVPLVSLFPVTGCAQGQSDNRGAGIVIPGAVVSRCIWVGNPEENDGNSGCLANPSAKERLHPSWLERACSPAHMALITSRFHSIIPLRTWQAIRDIAPKVSADLFPSFPMFPDRFRVLRPAFSGITPALGGRFLVFPRRIPAAEAGHIPGTL
jgi:hypothetical protein